VLVYGESVPSASTYSLSAAGAQIRLTSATPSQWAAGSIAELTLTGAGFDTSTTATLVAADGPTTYPAATVTPDTFTQITAAFNLTTVPQGTYSVRVSRSGGLSDTLSSAFTVTPPGAAKLKTDLILPAALGRHVSATFYIQYANTGNVSMPAP